VAAALIRRGFRVIKTDNAENFDFEETLVISQGREHRAEADEAIDALGVGELLLELRAPSGVVDVSIIVGHDIPAGEA
jgi:polyisoprenyl-teichoic acid--peptidoglycan teichoic acid transferase